MEACIITGCLLMLEGSSSVAVGDLFVIGDRFVFNGNVGSDGQLRWFDDEPPARHLRRLVLPFGTPYFERRGVLITAADRSLITWEAAEYVGTARLDQLGVR